MKYIPVILLLLLTPVLAWSADGALVTYRVDEQEYEGYYISSPDPAPFLLLIHDWDGLTDYEVKRANMLAKMGYTVFAADLFGKGIRPTEVKDKRQHTGALYKDREKMRRLMTGAIAVAKEKGARIENAVAFGYCFGGAAILELARAGADFKGFASFHGGLGTPEGQDYRNTKGEILVMHGTADQVISMDQFAALAEALETDNIDHEMITYGGAPHAFTVFESNRYREFADKKSWRHFTGFLKETLHN